MPDVLSLFPVAGYPGLFPVWLVSQTCVCMNTTPVATFCSCIEICDDHMNFAPIFVLGIGVRRCTFGVLARPTFSFAMDARGCCS